MQRYKKIKYIYVCIEVGKLNIFWFSDFNEFEIEFNLPVSVASMIESNPPESMQLQIRFGRKGGMTELSEGLPVLIQIYINNHKETAENSPIHFDCKPFLNLSGKNVIKISDWPYSFRPYYMVVDIVQKLTVEYMIEQVKICNRERSLMLHTKSKAMEIMKISEKKSDMEMCESKSYTINLLCPITNLKMKLPTRSLKCVHLQCFDLHSFFTLYKVKPIWKCPVCHKPIMLNDLVLDTFLLNIVNSANLPEICDRIIIYRNGNVEASLKHLKPKVNIIEYNLSE